MAGARRHRLAAEDRLHGSSAPVADGKQRSRSARLGQGRVQPVQLRCCLLSKNCFMNLLVLLTDGFGSRGSIAKFNRDLLNTLCTPPSVSYVIALPRAIPDDPGPLPWRLIYKTAAARGIPAYLFELTKLLANRNDFAGVICGHIHLLPA